MNNIEKLTQIFSQFPGIGPRQARRFVYYLLTRTNGTLDDLVKNIKDLKNDVAICANCQRFFDSHRSTNENIKNKNILCPICADQNRDHSIIMIVQRDADLESIEKNGGFNGIYFVLGGSVPILEKEPEKRIRIKELKNFLEKKANLLKEVIFAMNWNPEGENTGDYARKVIENTIQQSQNLQRQNIKITTLGKGLSMGTELEYADSDTLKNALRNRS